MNNSCHSLPIPVPSTVSRLLDFCSLPYSSVLFPLYSHRSLHLHFNSDMTLTTGFLLVFCNQLYTG